MPAPSQLLRILDIVKEMKKKQMGDGLEADEKPSAQVPKSKPIPVEKNNITLTETPKKQEAGPTCCS